MGEIAYPKDRLKRILLLWAEIEEAIIDVESMQLVDMKADVEMALAQSWKIKRNTINQKDVNTLLMEGQWAIDSGVVKETVLDATVEELYYILNIRGLR